MHTLNHNHRTMQHLIYDGAGTEQVFCMYLWSAVLQQAEKYLKFHHIFDQLLPPYIHLQKLFLTANAQT